MFHIGKCVLPDFKLIDQYTVFALLAFDSDSVRVELKTQKQVAY